MGDIAKLFTGRYKACLFDMDGVLTDTASVHAAAWKRTFDTFMADYTGPGETDAPFDIVNDYARHVDGKPRNDGVRDFLTSRHVELPEGTPEDAPTAETVWGVGNRKNELINKVLAEEGVTVYPGSVKLIQALRAQGMRTAVVSSSANTRAVLQSGGMTDLFDLRVDGVTIIERGLKGKPAPDTFLTAARELGVSPDDAVVFEDALAGVAAGKAGNFALVIGVDRVGHADALRHNGADIVVQDLAELMPDDSAAGAAGGQS